jgi:hypothetical protein
MEPMGIGYENHTKHISTICKSRCSSVVVMNGLVSWTTRVWISNRKKRKGQTHSGTPRKFHWLPEFFPRGRWWGGGEPDDSSPPIPRVRSPCNITHLAHSLPSLPYDNFFAPSKSDFSGYSSLLLPPSNSSIFPFYQGHFISSM